MATTLLKIKPNERIDVMTEVVKYPSNKDRSRLLGITNMGFSLRDYDPRDYGLAELESLMILGLMGSFCGQDDLGGFEAPPIETEWQRGFGQSPRVKWECRAEAWAIKVLEVEQDSFLVMLDGCEGKLLPKYWAGIDEYLMRSGG